MAEKTPRTLDVWLVDANTVYREVPYNVVTDWVQQGRLLENDRVRPVGTKDWLPISTQANLAAYLPRPVPEAEDRAEALEPVESGLTWQHRPEEEDDDVDMIPLIDVSLVLLIFFMLTAAKATEDKAPFPDLPVATTADLVEEPTELWIGILTEGRGEKKTPVYSLGINGKRPLRQNTHLDSEKLLEHLDEELRNAKKPRIEVTVNAVRNVDAGVVRRLSVELERRKAPAEGQAALGPTAKIAKVYVGVSEGTYDLERSARGVAPSH
jgi:biopolymer transport protein ExbD